jgi:hypothetical protein
MCGPYPKKTIAWEKIKQAVDKGFADENPQDLEKYVGDYVFNPTEGQKEVKIDEPVKVLEGGTGFMMITKSAFEKFLRHFLTIPTNLIMFEPNTSMVHEKS